MHMVAVTVHKKEKLHDHATGSNKKRLERGLKLAKFLHLNPSY